ncbi:unnamed protein product, partial [Ixodes persulcatus]
WRETLKTKRPKSSQLVKTATTLRELKQASTTAPEQVRRAGGKLRDRIDATVFSCRKLRFCLLGSEPCAKQHSSDQKIASCSHRPSLLENERATDQGAEKAKYVAISADCWKTFNRGFFGVTCLWLEAESLERKSAALCCYRIKGSVTYEKIAEELENVFLEYSKQRCQGCHRQWVEFSQGLQSFRFSR